jgi:NADPH-dependent curcumin reductase CurA
MPGFTAYHGLLKIGEPSPGETLVVASATGAVGSVVGQIGQDQRRARRRRCGRRGQVPLRGRHAGVRCLHRSPCARFRGPARRRDGNGIDIYFENVGGAVFDAVLPRLNIGARIPVCGLIAHYNDYSALPPGPNQAPRLMMQILMKRWRVQGFIITDHWAEGFGPFLSDMSNWAAQDKVKLREDFVDGIENAPQAFLNLLSGKNFGKVVVRVSDL